MVQFKGINDAIVKAIELSKENTDAFIFVLNGSDIYVGLYDYKMFNISEQDALQVVIDYYESHIDNYYGIFIYRNGKKINNMIHF